MSDSGRVTGDCRHGKRPDWCCYCLGSKVEELRREVDRLKQGDFTEEEFQNLCHNFSGEDRERFKQGCEEYQMKLFGGSDEQRGA